MSATYDDAAVTYDSLTVEFDGEGDEAEDDGSMSWFSATASGSRWVHVSRGGGFGFG